MKLWGMEPAMITSFVVALLTLLVSFGFPIDPAQRDAIVGLVTAALVLIGGIVIRQQVYPQKKVEAGVGPEGMAMIDAVRTEDIGTQGSIRG